LPGISDGFRYDPASLGFNLSFCALLRTLAIPVTPAAAIVVIDDSIEPIDSFIRIDDIPHRLNTNALPDTPADLRDRQDVVCSYRRLTEFRTGSAPGWSIRRWSTTGGIGAATTGIAAVILSSVEQNHKDYDTHNAPEPF
jgi:hypothetical protein